MAVRSLPVGVVWVRTESAKPVVFAGGGGLNGLAAGLGVSTAFLILETLLVLLLVFEAEGTGAGGGARTVPARQHKQSGTTK